ncbi:afadin isoform X2 [Eupeodes corollae]|uniref:afadin isoform X2 n=1 Tax=Eupeodes corollae TaxID=290404 RepID=UPI002493C45C|nr:afadin isoform X2 [Eupeodes corollae]
MTSRKEILDREAVRSVIKQWNSNRLDLFALSEPDENLLFHGVMRFYFQDAGEKVATKCIRVASDATVADVIDTLIEKFRPDMRMLSVPNYALYEVHSNGEERKLNRDEKPLLVQLNWHIDDREGRFLLKNVEQKTTPIENTHTNFKRKLSRREKKEKKKKDKFSWQNWESLIETERNTHASQLYTEIPETSFTRSISNPEAVMRRRRQQKLEKKLQQFRSRDGGPDTGGTLKIYGESLCEDVPYKTLLLSIRDCAQAVVREMLYKYGLDKSDPLNYCLVQVNFDGTEYILDDDECPLSILMNHPTSRGSIMFHVRRRPAESHPRRRKKKPLGASNENNSTSTDRESPVLVEVTHRGDSSRRINLGSEPIEVGSANTNSLQLFGPSIQARHCLFSILEGVCTVTPLHPDALTFVNGHQVTKPTILHNGSVVMIGRVASYRFLDSPSDGRFNLALSQSQLDSACLYEKSLTLQASWASSTEDENIRTHQTREIEKTTNDNQTEVVEAYKKQTTNRSMQKQQKTQCNDNEPSNEVTDLSLEGETKSISSLVSTDANEQDQSIFVSRSTRKMIGVDSQRQELILPAVLEFPEKHQAQFLTQIITELDVTLPHFKLAPVYSLYLCARYRASTHYRPELQPAERAHKLTIFLHHVANLIYSIIEGKYTNAHDLAFWMANSSEFLHFLKSDRHISAFSIQAQEVLAESVQSAFHNLVNCFRVELSQTLNQFLSETNDHDLVAGSVLTVLGSAMALLRKCRVNAALTIQLFSQLFHYINAVCFNTIMANTHMCTAEWGKVLTDRLLILELWAERQGLELAADCHLAKINQCAQFLQSTKTNIEEVQKLACSCFRLNSLQMAALLEHEQISRNLKDAAVRMAESVADELARADGREVRLEETPELHLVLLLPDDGFSCDVVRGIPSGLVDFLSPLQLAGICRLAAQPTSIGLWTVYMHQFNARSPSEISNKIPEPEIQAIKLQKNSNGMGLSIVAAKGAGQEQLGIYIKSVVPGGAADADNRLQAGDQLLRVDGQSLVGITQERAADYLVRTGPLVTLEVAKQGAIFHGLATLLQQPSPLTLRGKTLQEDVSIIECDFENNKQFKSSKSFPILHHTNTNKLNFNSNSRSSQSLPSNEQNFYQNLSPCLDKNLGQTVFGERLAADSSLLNGTYSKSTQQLSSHTQQLIANTYNIINRPTSTYYKGSSYADFIENKINPHQMHDLMSCEGNSSFSLSKQQQNNQQTQVLVNNMESSKSTLNFNREGQPINNLILAPSMPNISDVCTMPLKTQSSQTGLQSSQSMQNVAIINQAPIQLVAQQQCLKATAQQPINYVGEKNNRKESKQNILLTSPKPRLNKSNTTEFSVLTSKQQYPTNILDSQSVRVSLNNQKQTSAEKTPPLPPTTTHPLFKNISQKSQSLVSTTTSSDTQRGTYSPINVSLAHQKHYATVNLWELEGREKEHDKLRQDIRICGEKIQNRYAQQEEQLKTLALEREFQRRVQEAEEQDKESELAFEKDNKKQEHIRASDNLIQSSNLNCFQIDIDVKQDIGCLDMYNKTKFPKSDSQVSLLQGQSSASVQPKGILKNNRYESSSFLITNSILPSKPTYKTNSDKIHNCEEKEIINISKDISNLSLDIYRNNFKHFLPGEHISQSPSSFPSRTISPPPPPERNVSYIVMSQKQQSTNNSNSSKNMVLSSAEAHNQCNNNIILKTTQTMNMTDKKLSLNSNAPNGLLFFGRDTKRVTFHYEDNNHIPFKKAVYASDQNLNSDNLDTPSLCDISASNEILESPSTIKSDLWNSTVKSTPGVIGAQEVYRDPRQRRLAEQHEKEQKRSNDAVPEKLSFKEKMKMFAFESGEDQTPKDKLKISRAQRDIDAAH